METKRLLQSPQRPFRPICCRDLKLFTVRWRYSRQAALNAVRINQKNYKNMKIKSTILLLLSAVILSMTAQAEPKNGKGKRPNPGDMFQKLDADESGTISKDEAKGPLAEHFDKIDADGNGELTKDELKAAREGRGGRGKGKLQEADTDSNGAISLDEAETAGLEKIVENFSTLDADGNGEISKEEFKAAHQGREKRGGGEKPEGRSLSAE